MMLAHASVIEHAIALGAGTATLVLYLRALARESKPQRARATSLCAAIALLLAATAPYAEGRAGGSFTAHMIQHLVLYCVVPPLLVFARPIATLSSIVPSRVRGRLHRLLPRASRSSPLVATAGTIVVLFTLHLTPLYDAALDRNAVHLATHVALLLSGVLVWNVALKPGVSDGALRFGAAITLNVPTAILGVILTTSATPLSSHYVSTLGKTGALVDQRAGGALMWIGAMVAGAALMTVTLWRWASREQAIAEQVERVQDRSSTPATTR